MKLGGDAVAEVLRDVPSTRWLTPLFDVTILGVRPFAQLINLGYLVLADVRPLLGCASCGTPAGWIKPLWSLFAWIKHPLGTHPQRARSPHFTASTKRAPMDKPAGATRS